MKYVIEFEEVVRYQVEVEGSLQDVSTRWHNIDVHAQFDANADCVTVLERQLVSVTDAEQQLVPLDQIDSAYGYYEDEIE